MNEQKNLTDTERSGHKYDIKEAVAFALLIVFCVFYALKLTGHFDFSGRYNIKRITASKQQYDVMMMIDEEYATVWGEMADFQGGDYITVEFRKEVNIKTVQMYFTDKPDELELIITNSENGRFAALKYETVKGVMTIPYDFPADKLQFRIPDNIEDAHWCVSELEFTFTEDK